MLVAVITFCVATLSFGTNLRNLRKQKGLTQVQLADKSGVDQSMVSKYERDESEPTLANAVALAEALGVGLAELAGRPYLTGSNAAIEKTIPSPEAAEVGELYERVEEIRQKIDEVLLRRKPDTTKETHKIEEDPPTTDGK